MTPNLSEMNCATCEHFDDGFCTLPDGRALIKHGYISEPESVVCVLWERRTDDTDDEVFTGKRYCEMCDKWVSSRQTECRECGAPTVKAK
jgi:hypothetical protein